MASMPTKRNPGLVDWEKLALPENLHAIPVDQFCMRLKNVGIATVRFQSLNNGEGNCMRHLWGTMRECHALAGRSGVLAGPALLPRLRRRFADGEDRAEGLVLRGRIRSGQQEFCGCRS